MRRAIWVACVSLVVFTRLTEAQEQFPGDPLTSAANPYITNQFMQLAPLATSPLMMHTGIDIQTGAGASVTCPIRPGSDCMIINNLNDPNQVHALLMVSRQMQSGDYAIMQFLHIDRNPNLTRLTPIHTGDWVGDVTAVDQHLHAELALTPQTSGSLDEWLYHPQVYAFSQALRWNVDTYTPWVDQTIVHPGASGVPTFFEVNAYDQADAHPSVLNGIFEIRLYVDDNLVDAINFDRMRGRDGSYPFSASDYYYCTTAPCIPTGSNAPNVLRYRLKWITQVGNHIWRLDIYDWKGNLRHGDPNSGLPGREAPRATLGGTIEDGKVHVTWRIDPAEAEEAGIESYNLWQAGSHLGEFARITTEPISAAEGRDAYSFTGDVPAGLDSVWYRLTAENSIGSTFELGEAIVGVPRFLDGIEGYPNPIREQFTVALTLARAGAGDIAIFDLHGRRVRTVLRGNLTAGVTRLIWDGNDDSGQRVPNGVYLLKVTTEHGSPFTARKIALFR